MPPRACPERLFRNTLPAQLTGVSPTVPAPPASGVGGVGHCSFEEHMIIRHVENVAPCPCGSGGAFGECCSPYLAGTAEAPTAERLMRSRYTAYVLGNAEYLSRTWHPATRPADLGLDDGTTWQGLTVISTSGGGEADERGIVEFTARCRVKETPGNLHEVSEFVRQQGRWFYLDGEAPKRMPVKSGSKIGRNEPCPCGSGKKYKRCCGAD